MTTAVRMRAAHNSRASQVSTVEEQSNEDDAADRRAAAARRRAGADTPDARRARLVAAVSMRSSHRGVLRDCTLVRTIALGDALPAGAAAVEIRGGTESAARRACEIVGPIAKRARSWGELHRDLANENIAYQAKGSGAVLVIDGIVVKASTARDASRTKLEKRLGPFEPASDAVAKIVTLEAGREHPPRPAPGVDPDTFAASCEAKRAASLAQLAYQTTYAPLAFVPMLMAAVAGGAPRAAPGVREIARQGGNPKPKWVPVTRASAPDLHPKNLLAHYDTALQADRYRLVAERSGTPQPTDDGAKGADRGPDRVVQLSPRPMAEIAAAWHELMAAAGSSCAVFLKPQADKRHHIVLSGLNDDDLADLRQRHTPSLVLQSSAKRYEVVLSTGRIGLPYETAAVAAAATQLRERYRAERGRYGLCIRDDRASLGTQEPATAAFPVYAQVVDGAGLVCRRLKTLITDWIVTFCRWLGRGAASRLGRGRRPEGAPEPENAPIYWAHRADILAFWQGRWPDASRVDTLIARRMQAGGHTEPDVAALITACAPAVDTIGRHDWDTYGRRAAAHAFHDTEDSCWAYDQSPADWQIELEKAVKARTESRKTTSLPPIDIIPEIQPLPEEDHGKRKRTGPATPGSGNKRDDGFGIRSDHGYRGSDPSGESRAFGSLD